MALLSAFFGFDSPRCLRWPSAGVCWLRGGPPACGSGSAQCQGRRGRGEGVSPVPLPQGGENQRPPMTSHYCLGDQPTAQ